MKTKEIGGAFLTLPLTQKFLIVGIGILILIGVSYIILVKHLSLILLGILLLPFVIKGVLNDQQTEKENVLSHEILEMHKTISQWVLEILQTHCSTLGLLKPEFLSDIYVVKKKHIKCEDGEVSFGYMAYRLAASKINENRIKEIFSNELLRKRLLMGDNAKLARKNFKVKKVEVFDTYIEITIGYLI